MIVGTMSFSNRRNDPVVRRIYNKWRMVALCLSLGGLVTFLFSLDLVDITKPLMALSVIMLWGAVLASHKYVKMEEGRSLETAAKISYNVSLLLALVISVLVVITLIRR